MHCNGSPRALRAAGSTEPSELSADGANASSICNIGHNPKSFLMLPHAQRDHQLATPSFWHKRLMSMKRGYEGHFPLSGYDPRTSGAVHQSAAQFTPERRSLHHGLAERTRAIQASRAYILAPPSSYLASQISTHSEMKFRDRVNLGHNPQRCSSSRSMSQGVHMVNDLNCANCERQVSRLLV